MTARLSSVELLLKLGIILWISGVKVTLYSDHESISFRLSQMFRNSKSVQPRLLTLTSRSNHRHRFKMKCPCPVPTSRLPPPPPPPPPLKKTFFRPIWYQLLSAFLTAERAEVFQLSWAFVFRLYIYKKINQGGNDEEKSGFASLLFASDSEQTISGSYSGKSIRIQFSKTDKRSQGL